MSLCLAWTVPVKGHDSVSLDFASPLCFESRAELDQALDDYLSGDKDRRDDVEFVYGPIRSWCTKHMTDFSHLFDGYSHPSFNEAIDGWDMSSAKTTSGMFFRADAFNQDISSWDMSSVEDMSGMFAFATSFDQDLSKWSTGHVKTMRSAFEGAESFTKCQGILQWDTRCVDETSSMLLNTGCGSLHKESLLTLLGNEAYEEVQE
jgi:surface protein